MFKMNTRFMAVALAATTIAASAQTTSSRGDMFGQEAPSIETPAASTSAPRKVRITNGPVEEGDDDDKLGLARTQQYQSRDCEPRRQHKRERAQDRDGRERAAGAGDARELDGRDRLRQDGTGRCEFDGRDRRDVEFELTSEFQKFLWGRTGKLVPIFGSEFFSKSPATFSPVVSAPLPLDHPLGPGDELLIRGTGTIDIDFRAKIDRNGTISIPTVGSVVLAGVKAGDAEGVIRASVARLYKGVAINVAFGQLRAITVYVVGQARHPGTYTVPSLSTLVTALFASGGPNANGSLRRVQIKRAGKLVAELDLYAFIAKGDKAGDIKLQDGDSIYIPPARGFVGLVGMVNAPAIYEIKDKGDTVESLLDVAGGLPVVADPRRVFLERIDSTKRQPRTVEQFALNGEGLKRNLKDGDVLNITSITPDFSNAVVLRGNVDQPVRAPFKSDMRVSDLIPNREYLITRESIKRQNDVLTTSGQREGGREEADTIAARIGGLIQEINWDYAVVERINRADLSVSLIPFNLGNVFSNPGGPDNVQLQPGDTVTIFSQEDVAVPMDKRRIFVRVEGEVNVPGVYQMSGGETVQSLLARAGGPTTNGYLFGTAFYREQVRKEQEINLEKAAVRLEAQMRSEQSRGVANVRALSGADAQAAEASRQTEIALAKETIARFRQLKPTGRIAFGLEPKERSFARLPQLKLENGDRLVIPARPDFVHVFGAVNAEASPLWRPNSRVKDYLKLAGVTADADIDNVFVMRVDGTVISRSSITWMFNSVSGMEVMPGDTIVIPEKFDKETTWTKFTKGTREWAQIFANFGLGAAAIKTLRN
jgi:protein involved in polysaccharide export with SLBB domain